jgi:hypothetical protein
MGSDDEWKPYQAPTTWSREGHTFMRQNTIENLLRNTEIDLDFFELIAKELCWRSPLRDRGEHLYAVQGGIGAFIEDCRAVWSLMALEADPVLPSKV